MENNERLNQILKELNDNRSKLSALFSLYNSSLIMAEDSRSNLMNYYEQMIDFKNDLSTLSTTLANTKKEERQAALKKNKSKIIKLDKDANEANANFENSCSNYKIALQDCGSLKTEYKHAVSELCKEFKSLVNENKDVPFLVVKGYKQQVKIIRAILDKIEALIADYNVKRNKVELDSENFKQLYESVNSLISKLKETA